MQFISKFCLFCLFIGIGTFVSAQKIDSKITEGLNIRNIGPAGMSGRVTSIAADPEKDATLYIGTASGGVWTTTDAGTTWSPIFDEMPTQGIGSIAVHPSNPDVLWVGTGEGNPRNSQSFGAGLFKSLDRGKTWKRLGFENSRAIHRVVLHRDNPDIAWIGVIGSAYGPNERGVFKTMDGGKTFRKVLYVNDLTGCAELVVDPENPNKLFAAMWEYERKPYTFNSGGEGSGIYVSFDGGETWKKRTDKDGLPEGILGRCGLAIAPSNPNIVYALVEAEKNALYKSVDGGATWTKKADKKQGNRPFYYAEIYVHPQDENTVYSIHSTMTYSIDGGTSFSSFAGWDIHPDHHAFWIHPRNPKIMFEGNDGGLNISLDGGGSWRFVENLPVGQFYHINVDNEQPYNIYGGMQDNGSWVGPSSVWRRAGILNSDWQEVLFGDGFDVMPRPDDSRYLYAMYQGGNLYYVDKETGNSYYIRPSAPKDIRFNWNAALAQDPYQNCGVYYGSQYLHFSEDCGQSWEVISPDLTTNDTSKLHQDISGGLTIDATNAENYCSITAIAPSPVQKGVIWVGTDDGQLQLTKDNGKNWNNFSSRIPNFPKNGWIPQITVSEKNAGEVFVVVNNYRQNDWKPYLFHTKDFGATWTSMVSSRSIHTFCHSVVQDSEVPELLFLGTDGGLYFSLDYGKNWNKWSKKDFPSTPVSDLKIQKRDGDLVIGTFGRAIWILYDLEPLRKMATDIKVLDKETVLFQPETALNVERVNHMASHFPADAVFFGSNRNPAANFIIWKKMGEAAESEDNTKSDEESDKKDDKKKAKKSEKAKLFVFDTQGDTVKTLSIKLDTGFNKVAWRLDTKGEHMPSKKVPKKGEDAWGGPILLPGSYKVLLVDGVNRDSVQLEVKDDPRLNRTLSDLKARNAAIHRVNGEVKKATTAYNRLKKAEKAIKLAKSNMEALPDSLKKEAIDLAKSCQDSIKTMKNVFFEHEELKGIQRNPKHLNARVWRARSYVEDAPAGPSSNAEIPMKELEAETAAIIKRIDAFFEGDFKAFKAAVEKTNYSIFDGVE